MKKFLSLILVFSLLISAVSAAGYYENEPDVSIDLDSSIWWPSDYKISLMSLTPEESTTLDWIYEQLVDIWNDMRAGFTFVDEDIVAGNTVLSNLYTLLDGSDTTLTYILQGVGQTNGYLQITNNKLTDLIGAVGLGNSSLGRLESLLTLQSGAYILSATGGLSQLTEDYSLTRLFNIEMRGLGQLIANVYSRIGDLNTLVSTSNGYLSQDAGAWILSPTGGVTQTSDKSSVWLLLNSGIRGLAHNLNVYNTDLTSLLRTSIAGSSSDNVYSGTSIDNNNNTSSFSAFGLGPMLNTWLGDIQNDLGLLSFVFASPQDLELKNESEDNMSAIGDSLLSKDSKSSVKVKDISSISSASDSIQDFGDTGVTPAQAFSQLGNSDLLRFFSAQTASDLDSTVSSYSRDPRTQIVTNYYESSRFQFDQIISEGG